MNLEHGSHWFKVSSSSSNARAQGFSSSTFSMEEYHTESQNDLLAGYLNNVYDIHPEESQLRRHLHSSESGIEQRKAFKRLMRVWYLSFIILF